MSWERLNLRPSPGTTPTTLPVLIYGTAWKKNRTADLVYKAIGAGFRAIDTAAQPKHYREDFVGDGIRKAIREGEIRREDLYVQTKYTSVGGQDLHDIPYDPCSSVTEQVHASIRSSLRHLRPSEESLEEDPAAYLDAVVLHSPLPTANQTLEAWKVLETYVPHRIRHLGISNCGLPVLEALYYSPEIMVKPAVVQNRFHSRAGYDVALRAFCRAHGIIYQSFWTLTANPSLLDMSGPAGLLAQQAQVSPHAALYCLVLGLGYTAVLDGTTDESHMVADLAATGTVEHFAREHRELWQQHLGSFKRQIGESI